MEERTQKSSLVLKYGKRRYDGGSEIELIRTIERRQAAAKLNQLQHQHMLEVQAHIEPNRQADLSPGVVEGPAPVAQPVIPANSSDKVWQAWILGPMELSVGVVGMMTALLAIFTFRRLNNQALVKQSHGVFNDCLKTFGKGLLDTFTTPVRVLKVSTTRA